MRSIKNMRAFTLIEMVIVLVLLGILAALAIPTFAALVESSRQESARLTAEAVVAQAQALSALEDGNQTIDATHMEAASEDTDGATSFDEEGTNGNIGDLSVSVRGDDPESPRVFGIDADGSIND
jgi:prepilin-type N-terminal cleavage/methylation domain-containing protein